MIPGGLLTEIDSVSGIVCRPAEPMKRHTTLRVGGAAELWVVAETADAVTEVAGLCKAHGVKLNYFGDSHVLVRDGGLEGLWLRLGSVGLGVHKVEDGIEVGAAHPVAGLHAWMLRHDMPAIPYLKGRSGTVLEAYKAGLLAAWVNYCVVLRGTRVTSLSPEKHSEKQPLLRLGLLREPRPVEEAQGQLRLLPEQIQALGMPGRILEDPPDEDASMLIREAGLCGVRLRGARIGQFESNAMINLGESTESDLWLLIQMIRDRVRLHSGIRLQPSLRRLGSGKVHHG